MPKAKVNPLKITELPSDAENLCAILARVIERIAQTSSTFTDTGA